MELVICSIGFNQSDPDAVEHAPKALNFFCTIIIVEQMAITRQVDSKILQDYKDRAYDLVVGKDYIGTVDDFCKELGIQDRTLMFTALEVLAYDKKIAQIAEKESHDDRGYYTQPIYGKLERHVHRTLEIKDKN